MVKVPIIRKGVYKNYLKNGFAGGFLLGLSWFLLLLLQDSFLTSLWIGISFWIGTLFVFMVFGFLGQEYFSRRNMVKTLFNSKYEYLMEKKFQINEELFFEGYYGNYFFRVFPMKKKFNKREIINYDIINVFYKNDSLTEEELDKKENTLCGDYFLGTLTFENQVMGFLPKDWESPCFEDNFDGAINVLERQQLFQVTYDEWEKTVGKRLEIEEEIKEKKKIKRIYKVGRFIEIKTFKKK